MKPQVERGNIKRFRVRTQFPVNFEEIALTLWVSYVYVRKAYKNPNIK